jgi:hypothetical protein
MDGDPRATSERDSGTSDGVEGVVGLEEKTMMNA